MSTRKKNTTARPTPGAPDHTPDTAAAAPENGSGAGVPALRNDSDAALWAALGAYPGFATAELAGAAGIGVSTARRALSRWETAGVARSHSDPESPRAAKTWTTAAPAAAPEPAAPEPADPEPATSEPAAEMNTTNADSSAPATPAPADPGQAITAVAGPTGDDCADPAPATPEGGDDAAAAQQESGPRLRSGALRGHVEDFLRDHPDEDFSPHQIGKALNRSSGAVHNALVTLTKGGTAQQTSTAPKRFALAATPEHSGNPGQQPPTPTN
ncbi:hypothetical protein GV791_28810 [Nocardia cyriacigeorgica]|uniref:Uncharacterized protein n=1 Tax=Nocardia cyriacigeorgica TaxID=135487 RepID=A0A6P1CVC1_9NOCA|nr:MULTISPECIES: hypothetical protein [Nocardia]NEW36529.1 hypothetical protein [Nocardia cyriacigeorgica]